MKQNKEGHYQLETKLKLFLLKSKTFKVKSDDSVELIKCILKNTYCWNIFNCCNY